MREIQAVLDKYRSDCQPARIEPLGSAGGMSGAQFWRITAPRGDLLLRRWPTEHPSPDRLRFIHAVLYHAANRGIGFLPLPVTTRDGQSFIQHAGYLWELAPWMPGTADYGRTPSLEKLRAAMISLAQFHLATADYACRTAPGSAGGLNAINRHFAKLQELSAGAINELSHAITNKTWPELTPLARQFVAALPGILPHAIAQLEPLVNVQLPLQPSLRDIWHDHVLFTGDVVTGIIDFGAVDIDTPATDIARLLGSFAALTPLPFREGQREGSTPARDLWHEALAAYNTVRPLSHDETRAAHTLNTSGNILAGCNWIRWIYIEGRQFENHAQVIERFRRIVTGNPSGGGNLFWCAN